MNDDSTPRITALSPAQAARILAASGQRRLDEAQIRSDLEAGAPANADGTLNLIHYAAWLSWQAGDRKTEPGYGPDLEPPDEEADGDGD